MARISRKKQEKTQIHEERESVFRTGIYLRLSVQDNGKEEADSIDSQEKMLLDYIKEHPYLVLTDKYIDNGRTGTNFDRPGFNRMLNDVRQGKINCIVVKDLSRLGRNYVEAGDFIEKVFPFLNVRFIAVNDGYDSAALTASDELGASLKNLVNALYAKDISRKIGTAIRAKRRRGEYLGSYAPYGYKKNPENKNQLIIDPDTAPIVKEIFQMRAQNMGIGTIARTLNEKGYLSPGRLRFERGIRTNNNQKGEKLLWNRHVLTDLLRNVVYIGNLEQGRCHSSLYQGIALHQVKREDWEVSENTHQPIISIELWNEVQKVDQSRTKSAKENQGRYEKIPKRINPYGALLRCADCGRVLKQECSYSHSKKNGTKRYYTYKCPTTIELGENVCSKKTIRAAVLDQAVLEIITKQMEVFLNTQKILERLIKREFETQKPVSAKIREIEQEIEKRKKLFGGLYMDMKEGILTEEEYFFIKKKYQKEVASFEKELEELRKNHVTTIERSIGIKKWNEWISQYYNAQIVTKEMVQMMIGEIKVRSDCSIEIQFRYRDELEYMINECDKIRKKVS